LNPHASLKAADFKPPVSVLYRRVPGYLAICIGKLRSTGRAAGRAIPTNTVIYLALPFKQPPRKVPVGWVRDWLTSNLWILDAFQTSTSLKPMEDLKLERPDEKTHFRVGDHPVVAHTGQLWRTPSNGLLLLRLDARPAESLFVEFTLCIRPG
jgi:hypothetical protein